MAAKTPENGNDQASVQINKKILELKKKLLLAGNISIRLSLVHLIY